MAVLTLVDTHLLVLGAGEDGGDDITTNEQEQETIMQSWMVVVVEDSEQDQSDCSSHGEDGCDDAENLLGGGRVGCQTSEVTEDAVEEEGNIESDNTDSTHGNEKRVKTRLEQWCWWIGSNI